jgi:epoxide hydrolase-like predicted phosphatase
MTSSFPGFSPSPSRLRGLVVDWGGVLTSGLQESMSAWAERDDLDYEAARAALSALVGEGDVTLATVNPIHALERGELAVPHFEERLAARLTTREGHSVPPEGLLSRMFEHFVHAPDMAGLVLRARRAGIRTALLSNSWGNPYPRDGWDEMFDAVVISGEVGMRKPEPVIFEYTLQVLRLPATECVFVDDLPVNVAAAVSLGFVGVHHRSYRETAGELEALFALPLAS